MFVNTGEGGKTQQQQPLQNQTNASVRHNNPYPHTQQPHYEYHQGPVTFFTYPLCNVGGTGGGNNINMSNVPGGHMLYQAFHQPHSQTHPTQPQIGIHNAEQTMHYFTKSAPLRAHPLHHAPQHHSQMRNMMASVSHQQPSYMVSPNYFALSPAVLPHQNRAPILTNAASQHAVPAASGVSMATQIPHNTPRSITSSKPTAYVSPSYCTPPLLLGAAPTNVTPQPGPILTAATGIGQPQSLQAYTHISGGLPAAPSSSAPVNMQPVGLGGATSSNIEHTAKPRSHAIPVIHPVTKEEVPLMNLYHTSQPQTQAKNEISVESVSIQTDNDRSLTASIASDTSDIVLETRSQSISATDTDKIIVQMQNEPDNFEILHRTSGEAIATTSPSVPDANTKTQSLHSGSESIKNCVCEDPNDTDADANEHELDNEEDVVIDTTDGNLSVECIDQQLPTDILSEQLTEEIPNTDLVILQTGESDTEHSTETEVKTNDGPCSIPMQNSPERSEEKFTEICQASLQPSSSTAVSESKKTHKNRKVSKRKEKILKKLKQQKNKSSNVSTVPTQNKENKTTAHLKTAGPHNKVLELNNQSKKEEKKTTLIRYSLEDLKAFANSPESRKTPVVPCQKGDCISQLFVARQQPHHHHLSHQAGQNLSAINLQSYHHMNFNESIEFVSSKRRNGGGSGAGRSHQEHHSTGNSIAPGTTASGGGNSTQTQNKMPVIRINLSLNEEIKLSECKNAWQPKLLPSSSYTSESGKNDNDNIDVVLKKVRGILNKLTSENFDVLLKEMTSINIDTQEKMQKIMLLIFEKTVSEPNFAPTYAKFSKVLFEEAKAESKEVFNSLLIKRLEKEFELNVNNADAKERKLYQINNKLKNTKDQQEKIELQAELEHQEYQFRRRAWGTVRFIGEMYKLYSLSANRVFLYVESLLQHGNEEKLEYMCKLLTTVGNLLESSDNNARMNKIFAKIQTIVKESRDTSKKTKICSRVRFMMQDLIDMRSSNWGQSTYPHSSHIALRKRAPDDKNSNVSSGSSNSYERGSSNRMLFGNNNRHSQTRVKESGMTTSSGNYFMQKSSKPQYLTQREQHSIDLKKLNFSRGDETSQETELGNKTAYMWRIVQSRQTNQSNDLQQNDRNSSMSSQVSTSQQFSQKHHQPQKQHQHAQYWGVKNLNSNSDLKEILESFPTRDNEKLLNHLMEEYIDCLPSRSNNWRKEVLNTWQKANNTQQICLVYYILMNYLHLTAVTSFERNACANIFIYLMKSNAFNKTIFTRAYEQFAGEFPDLLMDVPIGWTYAFQFLGPLLHERLITFSDIWHPNWRNEVLFTERFVNALVAYFTREFGANYMRDLWHNEFKLERGQLFKSDQEQWLQFVASNKLQFLYDCKAKPEITSTNANNNNSTQMDQHMQRLEILLSSPNDSNLALDYINTNVNINSYFLKNLTRFLCCDYATTIKTTLSGASRKSSAPTSKNSSTCSNISSSSSTKNTDLHKINYSINAQLNVTAFRNNCLPLLRLCLDAHEDNELTCLDSVVDAIQQDYDANTANELICGIFDIFYDCEVIAKESFEKWYKQFQHNQIKQPLSCHLETYMQKLL